VPRVLGEEVQDFRREEDSTVETKPIKEDSNVGLKPGDKVRFKGYHHSLFPGTYTVREVMGFCGEYMVSFWETDGWHSAGVLEKVEEEGK